jgi:hypothetical protein
MMFRAMSATLKRTIVLFAGGIVGLSAVFPHPLGRRVEFFGEVVAIGLAAGTGTYLSSRTGLRSSVLDAAIAGRPLRPSIALVAQAIGMGIVTTIVLVIADAAIFTPSRPVAHASATSPPVWTGALYALYGGLFEEVVFHYGLLAALVFIAQLLLPSTPSYWLAITVSSLALGLFHVVNEASLLPLTPLVLTRTLVVGAAAGIASGWLYWRRGLEAAIVAHGIMSGLLHVAAPGAFG